HICLTVPIEHVIAKREATEDGGLLARLNAQRTNEAKSVVGGNSDSRSQVRQLAHRGLVFWITFPAEREPAEQLDVHVVSELRLFEILGHRSSGLGHPCKVVLRLGSCHEAHRMESGDTS